ncbi:glycosyl transferase [Geotalea uraniireducens]|uniref:Glycosyl transferase n=1 Tax=Geotalea uraniireducens TaxID=351604 RepID=A0ABM8EFD1_9BACT|nr:glycosyltransferase [Geotalea uraniireducens]BDV41087.1 glycosyl transferase [Geotalea uraniireducens]
MKQPKISVLMPLRNEAKHLPLALTSLFRQTETDWELVAVDDGSHDGTEGLLRAAAGLDPRIRVTRNRGEGLVAALNHGLALCRGGLVARMDGDDVSHPWRFARQLACLEGHPELGLLACNFRHFPRREVGLGMQHYESWQNGLLTHEAIMRDLYVESPFVHPSVMVRQQVLVAAGGYRERGWPEDYDLWLRLAAAGVRFARLPEVLFFWREHPRRYTRTAKQCSAQAFRACKAHHLRHGFLAGVNAVTLAGAGAEGRAWRQVLAAEGVAVERWLDVDPRKIGRELHGAPVVSPEQVRRDGRKILVTVGTRGARAALRQWAARVGLAEGRDYLCVT